MELYAVEVRTAQWLTALTWYRDALGIDVAIRIPEDEYALLIAGSSRIALMGRANAGSNDRVSLAFEIDDVETAEARLAANQTEFRRIEDHAEGLTIVNTNDPDGNSINLFRWPPRS